MSDSSPVSERSEFDEWIATLLRRYRTKRALAEAAGLTESAFWRQIRDTGSLGVPPLLRLALATGEPASDVLRRARKGDLADLIEQCYGAPQEQRPEVREFAALTAPPLPAAVVQTTLQQLRAVRQHLPAPTATDSAPAASPPEETHTRARRGARGK